MEWEEDEQKELTQDELNFPNCNMHVGSKHMQKTFFEKYYQKQNIIPSDEWSHFVGKAY